MTRMQYVLPRIGIAALAMTALSAVVVAQESDATTTPKAVLERAARMKPFAKSKAAAAIEKGVHWLLLHQSQDGRWDCDGFMQHDPVPATTGGGWPAQDVGVTSLALLALLAQADARHADAARRAADWLCSMFRDGRVDEQLHSGIYGHALATLALIEASVAFGDERHRSIVRQALSRIEQHHTPGAGWHYEPKKSTNTSVSAWCLCVYAAAVRAGFTVPARSAGEALTWLDRTTDWSTGRCGYSKRGERSARMPGDHSIRFPVELGESMTATALGARLVLGMSPQDALLPDAINLLERTLPAGEANAADAYYWYWGSVAMAQVSGSPQARRWQQTLEKLLLTSQRDSEAELGSWDPIGPWAEGFGRVGQTAFAVLCLSSPYLLGDTGLAAALPDRPPFRGVYVQLRNGKLGQAMRAIDTIDPATLTPDELIELNACRWLIDVEVAHCETAFSALAEARPDVSGRMTWLAAAFDALEPLPVTVELKKSLDAMRNDPAIKLEMAAAREMEKLRKAYDEALLSKSSSKRTAIRKKLIDFAERFPGTTSAAEVLNMLSRL